MKTETKTGRWKYAAIVLIVTLLVGLFWSYVKNGPKGEIYLYGEEHSKQSILDKELSIWGEYYEKGMRDLFVEFPYTDAQFLNLWMQADDDELLDLQFKDWEGTEGGTEVEKNFLKQIKEQYPETVFHGTDVGHTWESTGPRYLAYLEANRQTEADPVLAGQAIAAINNQIRPVGNQKPAQLKATAKPPVVVSRAGGRKNAACKTDALSCGWAKITMTVRDLRQVLLGPDTKPRIYAQRGL